MQKFTNLVSAFISHKQAALRAQMYQHLWVRIGVRLLRIVLLSLLAGLLFALQRLIMDTQLLGFVFFPTFAAVIVVGYILTICPNLRRLDPDLLQTRVCAVLVIWCLVCCYLYAGV
jgi:hypothetical protein